MARVSNHDAGIIVLRDARIGALLWTRPGMWPAIHSHSMGAHFSETHTGEDYLVNQVVKRACEAAEQIGEITFDQLNALLPAAQFTPEQIEQLLSRLAEKGIRLVED